MNKKITLSLSYFNDINYLHKHLNEWVKYKDLINFQIIDDCSEIPLVNLIDKNTLTALDIKIFRILDDLKWNIPGVRNLGSAVCDTEWILICDMDQYFFRDDIEIMYKFINKENNNYFYSFARNGKTQTAGTMLISLENYWKVGGYEEDFTGNYGWNDPFFRFKLNSFNIPEKIISEIICKEQFADCTLDRSGNKKNKKKYDKKVSNKLLNTTNILRFNWKREC